MNRILVLERDPLLRKLAINMLEAEGYDVLGLPILRHAQLGAVHRFGAIVLGSDCADDDGLRTCGEIRGCPECRDTPLLMVANGIDGNMSTDYERAARYIDAGVCYVLEHPFGLSKLVARVHNVLTRFAPGPQRSARLARNISLHLSDLPDVLSHGERVAELAASFAEWLGLGQDTVDEVRAAGLIHDVGKIAVPRAVLDKPWSLSPAERLVMARHADYGAKLCNSFGMPDRVVELVRHHHERHDGSGYPDGRVGHDIPLAVRVLALADALDALCEVRPYRAALAQDSAIRVLSGEVELGRWDPDLAENFFRFVERRRRHAS